MKRAIGTILIMLFVIVAYVGTRSTDTLLGGKVSPILTSSGGPPESPMLHQKTIHESVYSWYPVVRVVDGDTVVVDIDGTNSTIRLIGLDTPETVDPRKPVQCFGKEASAKAKQVLSGSSVRLETDSSQDTYDKYGRTLAYVYLPFEALAKEGVLANSKPEGILVNEYMIAEGYGHEYTYNLPYKYQAEFKAAEKMAREGKKGLWADDACEEHFVL